MTNHTATIEMLSTVLDSYDDFGTGDPVGFTYSESSRPVFIGREFVYKFDPWGSQNDAEEDNAQIVRDGIAEANMGHAYYVPETALINGVIVMERVRGVTLREFFGCFEWGGNPTSDAAAELMSEICAQPFLQGLTDIHSENLMLMNDGRIAIIDLGI